MRRRTLSWPSTCSRFGNSTELFRSVPNTLVRVGLIEVAHCASDSGALVQLISNVTCAREIIFVSLLLCTRIGDSFSRFDAHLQISSQVLQRA